MHTEAHVTEEEAEAHFCAADAPGSDGDLCEAGLLGILARKLRMQQLLQQCSYWLQACVLTYTAGSRKCGVARFTLRLSSNSASKRLDHDVHIPGSQNMQGRFYYVPQQNRHSFEAVASATAPREICVHNSTMKYAKLVWQPCQRQ